MRMTSRRIVFVAGAALLATACTGTVQTTSGQAYLDGYRTDNVGGAAVDASVREAAAVEPQLSFPARIGLARIASPAGGTAALTSIPSDEVALWADVAHTLGPSFGEFVPISPLVAEMMSPRDGSGNVGSVVSAIRLAAARQHVDVVLIYETFGTAKSEGNFLAIADLTIIGAFLLPNRDVEAQGAAQAILIDVRNGYPYAQLQAAADDTSLSASANADAARDSLSEKVRREALGKLIAEADPTMRKLRAELEAKRR